MSDEQAKKPEDAAEPSAPPDGELKDKELEKVSGGLGSLAGLSVNVHATSQPRFTGPGHILTNA